MIRPLPRRLTLSPVHLVNATLDYVEPLCGEDGRSLASDPRFATCPHCMGLRRRSGVIYRMAERARLHAINPTVHPA